MMSQVGQSFICSNYTRGEGANCIIDDKEDVQHKGLGNPFLRINNTINYLFYYVLSTCFHCTNMLASFAHIKDLLTLLSLELPCMPMV